MTWLPIAGTPLLTAALAYAAHGWRVFPVAGKVPFFAGGFHNAATDEATISRWNWRRATGIGWAIPAGVIVVDVDGRHGGIASLGELEHRYAHLPNTLEAVTGGGGLHIVLRMPPGVEAKQSAGAIAAGLDVRVGGKGYIVAAPSMHASGLRYRWQTRNPMVIAPAWLVDLVRIRPATPFIATERPEVSDRYARAVLHGEVGAVANAPEGTRNARLFAAWARLTRDGLALDRQLVRAELTRAARAAGLGEVEIRRTLREAA